MIHAIRKLAREIHRRSVWQVLGAYVLVGWAGFETVSFATARMGLPAWTPTMALVLLGVGLPVTIATAVAEGGLPWLRIEDVVDPNELEGLTPDEVHVIPEAHPMHGVGLFTWRNAVLLGVMSLALLVTSVVAYVTMWALGIGPVGSLLVQGAIRPSDAIVVAEFDNGTDERALGAAAREAFLVDLAESELFRVLGDPEVGRALEEMGVSPREPLTNTLAWSLVEAGVAAALVEGDVARVGGRYVVSVRVFVPPANSPAARFTKRVRERDDLVPAIDLLSERVRAKFGESLRTIRSGPDLTTLYGPSLTPPGL